jgi:hypothetical protein
METAMATMPSPKPRAESSRAYEQLLSGKGTSKQYVQTLKKEARDRVMRSAARRTPGA